MRSYFRHNEYLRIVLFWYIRGIAVCLIQLYKCVLAIVFIAGIYWKLFHMWYYIEGRHIVGKAYIYSIRRHARSMPTLLPSFRSKKTLAPPLLQSLPTPGKYLANLGETLHKVVVKIATVWCKHACNIYIYYSFKFLFLKQTIAWNYHSIDCYIRKLLAIINHWKVSFTLCIINNSSYSQLVLFDFSQRHFIIGNIKMNNYCDFDNETNDIRYIQVKYKKKSSKFKNYNFYILFLWMEVIEV